MRESEELYLEKRLNDFTVNDFYKMKPLTEVFEIDVRLNNRYYYRFRTVDIKNEKNFETNRESNGRMKNTVTVLLRTWKDGESVINSREICKKYLNECAVFVDMTSTELTEEVAKEYCRNILLAEEAEKTNDSDKISEYTDIAYDTLVAWAKESINKSAVYYDAIHPEGVKTDNFGEIKKLIYEHNMFYYPEYPEQLDVPEEFHERYNYNSWALYGVTHREDMFEVEPDNGKHPSELFASLWTEDGKCHDNSDTGYTARLKKNLDSFIETRFATDNRVGFYEIYHFLQQSPYGFAQCRLSAYLMGILLRSYLFGDYYWTDGMHFEKLTEEHIDIAVAKEIKNSYKIIPSLRKDYITRIDPDMDEYISAVETLFEMNGHVLSCSELRHRLRNALEKLKYPIWTLQYTDAGADICMIADSLLLLANPNYNNIAEEEKQFINIGKMMKEYPELPERMKGYITDERLSEGMQAFLNKCGNSEKIVNTQMLDEYMSETLITSEWKWIWKEDTVAELFKK